MKNNITDTGYLKAALIFACFFTISYMQAVEAIPAFARKNSATCSTCHTAWPMLNAAGRRYKENGYRFSPLDAPKVKITKDLKWDESLPVSVLFASRPYDKKGSGEKKVRAIHEIELMVAGPMGEKMSGFFEIEGEDEDTNARGFDVGIASAAMTYNHNNAVNLQFSWSDAGWFDPYNTYSHARRLTRGDPAVIGQSFGGADNGSSLASFRQNITVYGRPMANLFYGLSYGGGANDAEGVSASSTIARVAVDVTDHVMLGILSVNGTCPSALGSTNCTVDRDFSRLGFDFQTALSNLTLTGSYVKAEDDNAAATSAVKNDAVYAQFLYTIRDDMRPLWAPLARFDQYEKKNGTETISELTLGLNYYFSENMRGMFEFWDRKGDGSTKDDDRLTVQFIALF